MITFDKFQPNFLESEGEITRNPFRFVAENCTVWHSGQNIFQSNSKYEIVGTIDNGSGSLNVTLNNIGLEKFVLSTFNFNEISHTVDRVLWSKDMELGGENLTRLQPGNMSLFFCGGVMKRIYLNVYLPFEIKIEFNSDSNEDIEEVENPLKKIAEEINSISPYKRDIVDNYKIGYEKIELGDFESAITFFNLVIDENPNIPLAYYYRGFSKFHLNQYHDAIKDYTSSIGLDPSVSAPFFGRGFCKFRLQDFYEAILDFDVAIELDSDDIDSYAMRGCAKSNLYQFEDSIHDFNDALRLNPNSPKVYFNRGISRYNVGDERGALNDWKIAGDMGIDEGYDMLRQYGD